VGGDGSCIYGKSGAAMSDNDIAKFHWELSSGEEWQKALNNSEK